MPLILNRTIELAEHRCMECGRYYATEAYPSSTCPYCAESRAQDRVNETERLGRVVSALRGALTRAKGRAS